MSNRKQLYEAMQLANARIQQQQQIISGMSQHTKSSNRINPIIQNSTNYNQVLTTADAIQASNRYITDIPELNLPSQKLEYMWYLYGSLAFYREHDRPWVASYSKTGSLNGIGDLIEIYPIDFAGKIHTKKFNVVYSNSLTTNAAVIINDYTGVYTESQITPRCALNSVSITDQASVYRQMKNSIKLTAKKAIALLESDTQKNAVENLITNIIDNDAPVISIVAKSLSDIFKLHNLDSKMDMEGYIKAIEVYERLRANFNCIKTRAPSTKKAQTNNPEIENDDVLTELYLFDGLMTRMVGINYCKVHAIFKEGSCKINPILKSEEKEDSAKSEKGDNNADNK